MKRVFILFSLVVITLVVSCVRTVEKQDIDRESTSVPPFRIKECFLRPTGAADEYEMVRVFQFKDGREFNPGKLTLKVGHPAEVQIPSMGEKVPPAIMRMTLLSVSETNAVIESFFSSEGGEKPVITRSSIPVRNN